MAERNTREGLRSKLLASDYLGHLGDDRTESNRVHADTVARSLLGNTHCDAERGLP